MTNFWQGETYAIVKAMKATGNRPGIIAGWKDATEQWAKLNPTDPNAKAINAWLPFWQPRPFYTVKELWALWPALAIAVGHAKRWPAVMKSASRLEHELDYAGLPYFWMDGQKYYVVEQIHYWKSADESAIRKILGERT